MKFKLSKDFDVYGAKDEDEYHQVYEIAVNKEVGDETININGAIFKIRTGGVKKDKALLVSLEEESEGRKLSHISEYEDIQEFKTISERSGFLVNDSFLKHWGKNGESTVVVRNIKKFITYLCKEQVYGEPASVIKPWPQDRVKIYNNDTNPTDFVEVKDVNVLVVCNNKLYVIIGEKSHYM